MDNYKIGKLIKRLRKENHMTQAELGDKVGVGDRAVSKWERGITCPDISIINDLSKILGITSDELLAGELKPEVENNESKENTNPTKDKPKHHKLIIIIITLFLICIPILIIINNKNNKTYVYDMLSIDPEYYIEGKIIFENKDISIIVNQLTFEDKEFLKTIIKNYEYNIKTKNTFLYRYGYVSGGNSLDDPKSIKEFAKEFKLNYKSENKISKEEILKNNIVIRFTFLDETDQIITKEIDIKLKQSKEQNTTQ